MQTMISVNYLPNLSMNVMKNEKKFTFRDH